MCGCVSGCACVSECVCVLAVWDEALAQIIADGEYRLWTINQGTEQEK